MTKQLLLLFFLLLISLSQYADSNSGSIVKFLPGFEGPLPFELETGYIGVGEEEEVKLFYYFIKSERNPEEDPLLIWISGGPGCSSISGLLFGNGPLTFKTEGYKGGSPTLVSTTYSWTKVASIIFLDQPVGVGFSYTLNQLLDSPSDIGEAKQMDDFLRKWLSNHTEYISKPFYLGGDSYSGKVIPAAVQEISKGNDLGLKPQINLQGYVLGNPVTDIEVEYNDRVPFVRGMALISDELYEPLKRTCRGNIGNVDPRNIECLKFVQEFRKCTSNLNKEHILKPSCDVELSTLLSPNDVLRTCLRGRLPANPSVSYPVCVLYNDLLTSLWANDEGVRKALHVVKGSIGEWARCFPFVTYNYNIKSSVPYHRNNSIKGYRSLIYSGDHDLLVPFLSTQAWIRSLNYAIIDNWRPWMVHNQIAGYTRTYANKMTFATVKGGGHTPQYKPEESFIMFQRWISGQSL
ncbi:unnamed protein product [Arabis nemorensis]|uniref:Serine carboxypeptidase-like 7 n=1 Tax=Arabis nemorensis TaxID=586526 RepID=A0A565CML0_9BRAS|nr:unnamed protein product [Arabis nemorensis]